MTMGPVPSTDSKETKLEELDALELRPVPRLHLQHAARCAQQAPSPWNTQPWLLRIGERSLEVWADRSRNLKLADPHQRELTIACGAAAQHAAVALERLGWKVEVDYLPEFRTPDCLARITLIARKSAGIESRELYSALWRRHTQRGAYPRTDLCGHVGEALKVAALREGTLPEFFGDERRARLSELVEAGMLVQGRNSELRRERLEWIGRAAGRPADGIAARELGLACVPQSLMPFLLGTEWGIRKRARREAELVREAPCVLLLSSTHEEPAEWLRAGAALGRVLLVATAAGLVASFHDAAIEVPHLRHAVRQLAGNAAFPQVLLRLGYGTPAEGAGRRELSEICFDETSSQCNRGGVPCPLVL